MQEEKRVLTFDILRGYFLFVIMIDHLMRTFGFWEIFTGRGAQWVSAAEGFFFVSGIMIGMLRGAKMISSPIEDIFKKCWSRSLTLYIWAVGLTIFFSLLAIFFKSNPGLKPEYFEGNISAFITNALSLSFTYGWADFLSFYAVYLFFSPLAIWLLRKNLWQVVLASSLFVWINTSTMMGGWQIIFFIGVICGYYKNSLEEFVLSLSNRVRKNITNLIYVFTGLTLVLSVFFTTIAEEYAAPGRSARFLSFDVSGARDYSINILRSHFDKIPMQPLRLLLFFVWFSALFILVKKYEEKIKKYLGWFLITLGQNSLYVYIISAILLFFTNLVIPGGLPWYLNTLLNTAFVGLVWYLTKMKILFKYIPR